MRQQQEVLRYTEKEQPAETVIRHYTKWRKAQGIPDRRCDAPSCMFHTQLLMWNSKPLKLILDHMNGNNSDNRPQNLRFLCPNCAYQLSTHGGANKGKVKKEAGGFASRRKDGGLDYELPAEAPLAEPKKLALGSSSKPKRARRQRSARPKR